MPPRCEFNLIIARNRFPEELGAGMRNLGSSPTVIDCKFTGNNAGVLGGGMYNDGQTGPANPKLIDCEFTGNTAPTGGGMSNFFFAHPKLIRCLFADNTALAGSGGGLNNTGTSNSTLVDCSFTGNSATALGAGMHNVNSSPVLINCTFSGNTSNNGGGGMFHQDGNPTLTNCLFSGNTGSLGGGMQVVSGSPVLTNCTFSLNTATFLPKGFFGGAIHNSSPALFVTNCILWNNIPDEIRGFGTTIVTFSDVLGGFPGQGNINANPLFVDPVAGNFRLQPGSPARNAGNNSALPADTEDLDGDGNTTEPISLDLGGIPRIADGIVDMGAFECLIDPCTGQCLEVLVDCNGNGIPDACDITSGTSADCNGNFVPDECEDGTIDVIFIIDGSGSITDDGFQDQLKGIVDCLCGAAAIIPTDGSASVTVIQFTDVECADVALTVIDSPATAQSVCDTVAGLQQVSGGTELTPALDKAFEIFLTQGIGVLRHLFISTDAGVADPAESLARCEDLRADLAVKICTALVDEGCPNENEFLKQCANTSDSTTFDPSQPEGSYRCVPSMDQTGEFSALCNDCLGPESCLGDIDGDGVVAVPDLNILLAAWGPCPPPPACCPADLDGDGVVAVPDLNILLAAWGPCP